MSTKKAPYQPSTDFLFLDQKRKLKMINRIKKHIAKFKLNLEKPEEITN
ncbi:hypothetical protein ATE84_4913 [Aquimarina sp. MAR_2010_214]|nr:hypothetical protein [Aquimarina sp. MAR_2010_214]PKV52786.1 hypothetical protein ATE84_4913 [Aquimarina sp. MAR_2010_214]